MKRKYPKAKDLNGNEYLLESQYPEMVSSKRHNPETLILPFSNFGIGSRLVFEKIEGDDGVTVIEGNLGIEYNESNAIITDFRKEGNKFIIEAETNTKKEKKTEFINKIIGRIDMDDCLSDEFFIDMLSNVFTEKQLNDFLNKGDIEILLFDNLMYLKSDNKAYRL